MQLPKMTSHLKPLTLAVGLASAASSFAYADCNVDNLCSIVNSKMTTQYLQVIDSKESYYLANKFKFQLHLQRWERRTMFKSSVKSIVEDENFMAIVSMGKDAVPFIKDELIRKPSTLVWALNYIYGHKISSNPHLTISEACKLWIKKI